MLFPCFLREAFVKQRLGNKHETRDQARNSVIASYDRYADDHHVHI